jgi:hypothetical protein
MHLEGAIENILQAEYISKAVGVDFDPSKLIKEIGRLKEVFTKSSPRPFIQIDFNTECPLVEVV